VCTNDPIAGFFSPKCYPNLNLAIFLNSICTRARSPRLTEVSDADGKNVNGGGYISLKPYLINGFKELINISRVKAARW
jgi:hypothetical protein